MPEVAVIENNAGRWPKGELEQAVIGALWARETATARELFEAVSTTRNIVYTTVTKVLDRLVAKGFVRRQRVGRSYNYSALVEQGETHRAMARSLLEQIVGDGPEPAVAALIGALEDVSPELLDQLSAELAARKAAE